MTAPQRVTLSTSTTSRLRQLAAKTGLSPNIVARFAMLMSVEQPNAPAADSGDGDLTINRTTLFGEIEPFLLSALAMSEGEIAEGNAPKVVAAHISRGANYLQQRVTSIVDLAELLIQ